MRVKFLLVSVLMLSFQPIVNSQSVYNLNYTFTNVRDTTHFHAFLVRYDNGTGFYRVRFFDKVTKQDALIELTIVEKYAVNKKGHTDSAHFYYKGSDPKVILGDKSVKYYPEHIWFKLDPATAVFEPWKITSPDENQPTEGFFLSPPVLVEQQQLTRDFVSVFFTEEDAFYTNMFDQSKSRGTATKNTAKLFLVAVANTEDAEIGESCKKDQARNIKTFTTLSVYMGIQMITKTIDGKDFGKASVASAISELNPGPNDIVIFTYSGHGFTIPKQNRKFPNLDLRSFPAQSYLDYTLNIEDIFVDVKKKGARFNLVISDCCNNDPNSSNTVGSDIAQTRSSGLGWSMENCKKLFMNDTPMSILMTSADVGERASGNTTFGGFFSYYFKAAMENHFSKFKSDVTWEEIMEDARRETIEKAQLTYCDKPYTPENICRQHPFYKIAY